MGRGCEQANKIELNAACELLTGPLQAGETEALELDVTQSSSTRNWLDGTTTSSAIMPPDEAAPAAIIAPQGHGQSQAPRAAVAPVVQQEAPGASSAEVVALKQTVDDQAAEIAKLKNKTAKIDDQAAEIAELKAKTATQAAETTT